MAMTCEGGVCTMDSRPTAAKVDAGAVGISKLLGGTALSKGEGSVEIQSIEGERRAARDVCAARRSDA